MVDSACDALQFCPTANNCTSDKRRFCSYFTVPVLVWCEVSKQKKRAVLGVCFSCWVCWKTRWASWRAMIRARSSRRFLPWRWVSSSSSSSESTLSSKQRFKCTLLTSSTSSPAVSIARLTQTRTKQSCDYLLIFSLEIILLTYSPKDGSCYNQSYPF